jgi:hypothetical protein
VAESPEVEKTWVIGFTADDPRVAEDAAVVVGMLLDNFRGLIMKEFTDESALAERGGEAVDVLHAVLTADRRLSGKQRSEIEHFVAAIEEWETSEREADE